MLLWILLLSALARPGNMAMWGNPGYDPDCDPKYKALSPRHTMCLTAGPGRLVPLAKDSILHYHNLLRTNTTNASDLFKVYWDDELAEVAAHWVAQCDQYGPHDDDRRVPSLPGVLIGQNMAYGHQDFESTVIQGWYREIRYFKYGVGATVEGAEVGHFEQLMSKDVYRIGCAQAQCANGPYYICNYAWGLFSHKPYTLGPQCSTCPLTCNTDKLCDCGGLVCKNGGKLLLDKCRCLCPWNALGEDCATLKCDGLICKNMGRLDLEKCQCVCSGNFQGRDCGQEICSGKRCNNNGTLDKNTCQCVCQPHLSGEYCEKRECPIQDDDRCEKATKEQCEHLFIADAHLVKFACPYKCGLCPMAEDARTCQDDPSCTSFPNVLCKFHVQVGDKELQDLCPAKCQHCCPPSERVRKVKGLKLVDGGSSSEDRLLPRSGSVESSSSSTKVNSFVQEWGHYSQQTDRRARGLSTPEIGPREGYKRHRKTRTDQFHLRNSPCSSSLTSHGILKMMAGLSLVLVLLAFCRESHSLTGTPAYDANCDSNYKSRNSQHTMCLTAGPGTAVTVDKDDVVSYHNQKRAATTNAADLFRVYWDDEVAKVAEHWAKQCGQYGAHDDDRSAYTLPDTYIGQNMAYNYATFRDAIDAWYSEINNFLFGSGTTDASKAVGHYTQMVSKDVYRIGCGQASCANGVYYICNYVTGYHSNSPYTQGTQCSACPSNCNSDKLCDCGGLICRNKGTFNYNCTCTCQANTVGADCGTLVCPSADPAYPCNYITTTHCPMKWSGTPHYFKYQCPRKCGLCS